MNLSFHVLIVDDVTDNIQVAMNILREQNYQFSFATSGDEALALVKEHHFDLILLDIMMPGLSGFEVCEVLKADEELAKIPIIFLTAKSDIDSISHGFELGAADYLIKPFHPEELLARVKNHLELYASRQVLEHHNLSLQTKMVNKEKRLATELEKTQHEIIFVLTELMESTSDETGKHIRRVAEFSRLLALYHPRISDEEADVIYHATPMHDIGKIAIPSELIHKPGRLTEEEFAVMKTHTLKAHDFLKHSEREIMKAADVIALQHHEKWDGTGYPNGLKGENIHIYGRIVAIADVFDALTHKRNYKDAWSVDESVQYIVERRGKQFDPEMVDIFSQNLAEFLEIMDS